MFKEITYADSRGRTFKVNACEYVFHDPPPEHGGGVNRKLVRATTAAILLDNGKLYVGCSVCSEGDHFQRSIGRAKALTAAIDKMSKGLRSSQPLLEDDMVNVAPEIGSKQINKYVEMACLIYQMETFRRILADRADLIDEHENHTFSWLQSKGLVEIVYE